MPSFVHASLLWWGLPLVGVPVLIHLINMMRHRRVQWAAMEFLLAQPEAATAPGSCSSSCCCCCCGCGRGGRGADGGPAAAAQSAGARCSAAARRITSCCWTTASRCPTAGPTPAPSTQAKQVVGAAGRAGRAAGHAADLHAAAVLASRAAGRAARSPTCSKSRSTPIFRRSLEKVLGPLQGLGDGRRARRRSGGRRPAAAQEPGRRPRDLPGFRFPRQRVARAGGPAQGARAARRAGAQLHLVNCVDSVHAEPGDRGAAPGPGTRAAGVPLLVEVRCATSARRCPTGFGLAGGGRPRPAGGRARGDSGRQDVTRRFPVLFATAGEHQITARLETDAVAADNSARW